MQRDLHIKSNVVQIFHEVCFEAAFRGRVADDLVLILVEQIAYNVLKVHLQVVNVGYSECR